MNFGFCRTSIKVSHTVPAMSCNRRQPLAPQWQWVHVSATLHTVTPNDVQGSWLSSSRDCYRREETWLVFLSRTIDV